MSETRRHIIEQRIWQPNQVSDRPSVTTTMAILLHSLLHSFIPTITRHVRTMSSILMYLQLSVHHFSFRLLFNSLTTLKNDIPGQKF